MIGLAVLFLLPIYYIAKSKGFNAFKVCIICGLLGLSAAFLPYLFENAEDRFPIPVIDCTAGMVALFVVWLLPARKGAPGKAYLRIECECPACHANVTFRRQEEGKAVLCPKCKEIMTVPTDQYSPASSASKRDRPAVSAGPVCFDSFGNEIAAFEVKAVLDGSGIAAEIIEGTGGGILTQIGMEQGFKVMIDAKDWDRAVEIVEQAEAHVEPSENSSSNRQSPPTSVGVSETQGINMNPTETALRHN